MSRFRSSMLHKVLDGMPVSVRSEYEWNGNFRSAFNSIFPLRVKNLRYRPTDEKLHALGRELVVFLKTAEYAEREYATGTGFFKTARDLAGKAVKELGVSCGEQFFILRYIAYRLQQGKSRSKVENEISEAQEWYAITVKRDLPAVADDYPWQ